MSSQRKTRRLQRRSDRPLEPSDLTMNETVAIACGAWPSKGAGGRIQNWDQAIEVYKRDPRAFFNHARPYLRPWIWWKVEHGTEPPSYGKGDERDDVRLLIRKGVLTEEEIAAYKADCARGFI